MYKNIGRFLLLRASPTDPPRDRFYDFRNLLFEFIVAQWKIQVWLSKYRLNSFLIKLDLQSKLIRLINSFNCSRLQSLGYEYKFDQSATLANFLSKESQRIERQFRSKDWEFYIFYNWGRGLISREKNFGKGIWCNNLPSDLFATTWYMCCTYDRGCMCIAQTHREKLP